MKCKFKKCKGPVYSRGLCRVDYNAVQYLIRHGKTTWAELIKKGLALPPVKPGRKPGKIVKALGA
jgi:hypothetical protein